MRVIRRNKYNYSCLFFKIDTALTIMAAWHVRSWRVVGLIAVFPKKDGLRRQIANRPLKKKQPGSPDAAAALTSTWGQIDKEHC